MGEGIGIDSLHERDRDNVINDPNSTIIASPSDPEGKMIVEIFNSTPLEYGMAGLMGFNYIALKDTIKWRGLKVKEYVPVLLNCMTAYIEGKSRAPETPN